MSAQDDLERQRIALLAELDATDPPPDLNQRIAAWAMEVMRVAEPDLTEITGREFARQADLMLVASGIKDIRPGLRFKDGAIFADSASRGWVSIGTLDYRAMFAVASEYAERLQAEVGRGKGLSRGRMTRQAEAERKRARVVELGAQGLSQNRVAVKTGYSRKTVYRHWPRKKP